jgi:hypothetical protein
MIHAESTFAGGNVLPFKFSAKIGYPLAGEKAKSAKFSLNKYSIPIAFMYRISYNNM